MHFTSEPGLHFAFEPKWVRERGLRNYLTESWIKYWHYASKLIAIFIVSRGEPPVTFGGIRDALWLFMCLAWRILTRSSEWTEDCYIRELGVQRCNVVTIIIITLIFSGQQNTNKMIINTQTAVRDKNGLKTFYDNQQIIWMIIKGKKKCAEPL